MMRRFACFLGAALVLAGAAVPAAAAQGFIPSKPTCSISTPGRNALLRCPGDDNAIAESGVAVNPRNPRHVVVLSMEPFNCCMQISTSFDRGRTWRLANYPAPTPPAGTLSTMADPMVVFNRRPGRSSRSGSRSGSTRSPGTPAPAASSRRSRATAG